VSEREFLALVKVSATLSCPQPSPCHEKYNKFRPRTRLEVHSGDKSRKRAALSSRSTRAKGKKCERRLSSFSTFVTSYPRAKSSSFSPLVAPFRFHLFPRFSREVGSVRLPLAVSTSNLQISRANFMPTRHTASGCRFRIFESHFTRVREARTTLRCTTTTTMTSMDGVFCLLDIQKLLST
jgi:hypothetical protein